MTYIISMHNFMLLPHSELSFSRIASTIYVLAWYITRTITACDE